MRFGKKTKKQKNKKNCVTRLRRESKTSVVLRREIAGQVTVPALSNAIKHAVREREKYRFNAPR